MIFVEDEKSFKALLLILGRQSRPCVDQALLQRYTKGKIREVGDWLQFPKQK